MRGLSLRIDVGSCRVRLDRIILAANVEEHLLRVVIKLEAQPVPASLFGLKLVREEFMVHPTGAAHFPSLVTEIDRASRSEAREGNIVRCAARPICLLANAVFTVNDRKFFRVQRQVQLEAFIDRFQFLVAAMPLDLPIVVPDAAEGFVRGGDARAGSIGSFRMIKLSAIQIAQCEMRDVEILHVPSRGSRRVAADGLAEECQLESKAPSVRRFQIPSVIPPLRLKVRMIEMIARKFVAVSR